MVYHAPNHGIRASNPLRTEYVSLFLHGRALRQCQAGTTQSEHCIHSIHSISTQSLAPHASTTSALIILYHLLPPYSSLFVRPSPLHQCRLRDYDGLGWLGFAWRDGHVCACPASLGRRDVEFPRLPLSLDKGGWVAFVHFVQCSLVGVTNTAARDRVHLFCLLVLDVFTAQQFHVLAPHAMPTVKIRLVTRDLFFFCQPFISFRKTGHELTDLIQGHCLE